ncbi:hypothetical protein OW990_25345, partial [Klebsiella pneumoniae]
HTSEKKNQSVVYLGVGDSALFTIIPSYAHRENALRAFFRPEPQKSPSSHRKPPGIALINFTAMNCYAPQCMAGGFRLIQTLKANFRA